MFENTMVARMMKIDKIIPLNSAVKYILYDRGETTGVDLLLKIMDNLVCSCLLEDSGHELQHPLVCCGSLLVCVGWLVVRSS